MTSSIRGGVVVSLVCQACGRKADVLVTASQQLEGESREELRERIQEFAPYCPACEELRE